MYKHICEYWLILLPPSLDATMEMHMTERITGLVGGEAANPMRFTPTCLSPLSSSSSMCHAIHTQPWVCGCIIHHIT